MYARTRANLGMKASTNIQIAGLSYVVYIALCIVTQRSLRRMYGFRTSVQLNILGSPEEVDTEKRELGERDIDRKIEEERVR
eukprot:1360347-Amorphochlora_amoeboformis.AAC.1